LLNDSGASYFVVIGSTQQILKIQMMFLPCTSAGQEEDEDVDEVCQMAMLS